IIRDNLGIGHIFAKNENDLFFACGYLQAQDRLWQMELSRRAAYGTLSEIFGEKTLEYDIQARVLGLRRAAEADYKKLSPKLKILLSAYCNGVNYCIKTKKTLPLEFLILRDKPRTWTILDSLLIKQLMAFTLSTSMNFELLRIKLIGKIGEDRTNEIFHSYSGETRNNAALKLFDAKEPNLQGRSFGSNNWVVGGTLSQTGKPLLANDPHLGVNILPSVWFGIHLNCPGINVIGASLAGVPAVVIGHNDNIAWGITNSFVDVQDLFLEKLDQANNKYLFNGEWRDLTIFQEKIVVRGRKNPKIIKIKWNHRGPIITPWVIKSDTPISLRWVIHDGGKTYESFYLINKAKNWESFLAGVSLFDTPSQNFVYADQAGNIGYYLGGKIPIRNNHKGLFPMTGETDEYDWIGYVKETENPLIFNPIGQFIVTANNKIASSDYPVFLSDEYLAPFRAERIKELLLKQQNHSLQSFKDIQLDKISRRARYFLPLIRGASNLSGDAKKAQDILTNWNGEMTEGKEAALFHLFIRFFKENSFEDELEECFPQFRDLTATRWAGLLKIMNNPQSRWFDIIYTPEIETREDILRLCLAQAFLWLIENSGASENWDWARMHSVNYQHALGQVPILSFFNRGPFSISGSEDTVNASFYDEKNPYQTNTGVSYRQIIDLANMKNSVFVFSSGQSGHLLSRHYDDQIQPWLDGEYYPMLFDYIDIVRAKEATLILKPASSN
ncbi:penicillin acylase family protein, partial [Acidobacteriota bacterium]